MPLSHSIVMPSSVSNKPAESKRISQLFQPFFACLNLFEMCCCSIRFRINKYLLQNEFDGVKCMLPCTVLYKAEFVFFFAPFCKSITHQLLNFDLFTSCSPHLNVTCGGQNDLKITHHADNSLNSFCKWQKKLNMKGDEHPLHHDVSVLLTR